MTTQTLAVVLAQAKTNHVTTAVTLAGVLMALGLMMWAAQRGKAQVDPHSGALLFRHNVVFRGVAILSLFGMPLAISLLLLFKPPQDAGDVKAVLGIYAL